MFCIASVPYLIRNLRDLKHLLGSWFLFTD